MLGDVLTTGSLTLVKSMMYSPTNELLSAAGHVRMTPPMLGLTKSGSFSGIYAPRLATYSHLIRQKTHDCQEHLTLPASMTLSMPRILSENEQDISVFYGHGNGLEFINSLQPGDHHRTSKQRYGLQLSWSMADILNREIAFTEMTVDIVYRIC